MPTQAEVYAEKIAEAMTAKPVSFLADGKEVATVTADGRMAVVSATLSVADAKDLRSWIKTNFVSPTL